MFLFGVGGSSVAPYISLLDQEKNRKKRNTPHTVMQPSFVTFSGVVFCPLGSEKATASEIERVLRLVSSLLLLSTEMPPESPANEECLPPEPRDAPAAATESLTTLDTEGALLPVGPTAPTVSPLRASAAASWSKSLAPFVDGAPEMSFLKPVGGKGL